MWPFKKKTLKEIAENRELKKNLKIDKNKKAFLKKFAKELENKITAHSVVTISVDPKHISKCGISTGERLKELIETNFSEISVVRVPYYTLSHVDVKLKDV